MSKYIVILFRICFCVTLLSFVQANCDFQSRCRQVSSDKINIHLVPHSHDDVGWLKTIDQYYYGTNSGIQNAGVQYIISSTVEALKRNPDRRFIQVETAYFWKWWQLQNDTARTNFKQLVDNGQIEMINGAWSMNDEATTNYQSIIDQYTWGIRRLNETLGACGIPKVAWQIDPFGHSKEYASILSQIGFSGLFLGRIDYRDKSQRIKDKNLDFIWKTSQVLGNSEIFTSIFPDFYTSPLEFCFDILCGDSINDDKNSTDYNLELKINTFSKLMKTYSAYYKTRNILIPMGGDFQYQAAEINFFNMDKLINTFAENSTDFEVFYSTPSCYIKAVNDEMMANSSIKFSVKTDDFFPHATDPHAFWTGYFSSRPNLKRFERIGNNILQVMKQLSAISKIHGLDIEPEVNPLREIMGVMQHHDAITGTEKQHVALDYIKMLTSAINNAIAPAGNIIGILTKEDKLTLRSNLTTCLLANISVCETSEWDSFVVVVYNPLSKNVSQYIRLPVQDAAYTILGSDGFDLLNPISKFENAFDKNFVNPAPKELLFEAADIPPLGFKIYQIIKNQTKSTFESYYDSKLSGSKENLTFGTQELSFEIDDKSFLLKKVKMNDEEFSVTQEFAYYTSAVGDNNVTGNRWERRASGAYIFRPSDPNAVSINVKNHSSTKGQFFEEFWAEFEENIVQVIRVYKGQGHSYIEFDWLVGPINVDTEKQQGKEIITRFVFTGMKTGGYFYTDSNGRQMIQREKDSRKTFSYNASEEPVSSNYYPVTSRIVIKDNNSGRQFSILTDRAQGGSSLEEDTIELMIHRRILHDDDFGVAEALNELEFNNTGMVVRGRHYLIASGSKHKADAAKQERDLSQQLILSLLILVGQLNETLQLNYSYSTLSHSLPDQVQILSFEPWQDDTYLLRLENIFEDSEVTVDLNDLLLKYNITHVEETTLAANQWMKDYMKEDKYKWNKLDTKFLLGATNEDGFKKTLKPMEIRTFVIKIMPYKEPNHDDNAASTVSFPSILIFMLSLIILNLN